ncbi:hypothetical protein D3C74_361140 [compost metagenome]
MAIPIKVFCKVANPPKNRPCHSVGINCIRTVSLQALPTLVVTADKANSKMSRRNEGDWLIITWKNPSINTVRTAAVRI